MYGRSNFKIAWTLFLKFIREEEDFFRIRASEEICNARKKGNKINFVKTKITNKKKEKKNKINEQIEVFTNTNIIS